MIDIDIIWAGYFHPPPLCSRSTFRVRVLCDQDFVAWWRTSPELGSCGESGSTRERHPRISSHLPQFSSAGWRCSEGLMYLIGQHANTWNEAWSVSSSLLVTCTISGHAAADRGGGKQKIAWDRSLSLHLTRPINCFLEFFQLSQGRHLPAHAHQS